MICVDSPYDVSGLPYPENYEEDTKPPQQVSLSYDESLESGYSTPNSRGRRIIREIIVWEQPTGYQAGNGITWL